MRGASARARPARPFRGKRRRLWRWALAAFLEGGAVALPASGGAAGGMGAAPPLASSSAATGALVAQLGGAPRLVCTATFVAPRVLITAAHCAAACAGQPLELAIDGDPAANDRPPGVAVRRAFLYPAYDLRGAEPLHDVALIELDEPVVGVEAEAVLKPADADRSLRTGVQVALVGYGKPRADGGLQGERYTSAVTITRLGANEMAVGGPGEPESVEGDSGGPAFIVRSGGARWLAGVVSRTASGTILTRVDAYADWIAATLRAIEKDPHPSAASGTRCAGSRDDP